jgi:hypothetical protein
MTGFEYQAAAHMIYEGMVEEGLRVIAAVRDRFDGHRRNPWNEQECGHHYARAMASWAAVLALSGFRYSAVTGLLQLMPRRRPEAFQCFWVVPTGWGAVYQTIAGGEQLVRWEVLSGELGATRMRYALPEGKTLDSVTLEIGSRLQAAETTENAGIVDIVPAVPVQAAAGRPIVVHIRY